MFRLSEAMQNLRPSGRGARQFHYVRDPWGGYCECSCDIDYVPGDGTWKPSHVTPDNGFYLWGPLPPEDFAYNYESTRRDVMAPLLALPLALAASTDAGAKPIDPTETIITPSDVHFNRGRNSRCSSLN